MKVRIFFMAFLFYAVIPLFSADSDQILEQLYSGVLSHKIVKGEYIQNKVLKKINHTISSGGTFIIDAAHGVIFDVHKPFPAEIVVGQDRLVQKLPDGTVSILDGSENAIFRQMANIVSSVFMNDLPALKKNFDVTLEDSDNGYVLHLIPCDSLLHDVIPMIVLDISDAVDSVVLHEGNGNTVEYIFSGHTYPDRLEEYEQSLFSMQ